MDGKKGYFVPGPWTLILLIAAVWSMYLIKLLIKWLF